jgi:hypothetical protein
VVKEQFSDFLGYLDSNGQKALRKETNLRMGEAFKSHPIWGGDLAEVEEHLHRKCSVRP